MRMHRFHDRGRVVRTCDRKDLRMGVLYNAFFRPQAAGHDDLSVLLERFANGVERFLDGVVDEAAGIDDDEVGAGVVGRGRVALGAQLREDALGVDERFRAA